MTIQAMSSSSSEGEAKDQLVLQRRLLTPFLLKKVPPVPLEDERSEYPNYPRYTRPVEWILFTWLLPVMRVGYKRTLEPADLFRLNDNVRVETLATRFQTVFARRLAQSKEKHVRAKASGAAGESTDTADYKALALLVVMSVLETFFWQYPSGVAFMMLGLAIQTCTPLLSKHLIAFVLARAFGLEDSTGKGVGYALGVTAMIFVTSVCLNHAMFLSTITGAETRGMLIKAILDKSFLLNAHSRKRFPPLKITSIMSTDVSRIDLGIGFSIWTFSFPVPIAISIGILVDNLRAPAMVGVGIMFAYLFIAAGLGALLFLFRNEATKLTDARVGLMKEVLNNLKMIKFYSWEVPYFKAISTVRTREMKYLLKMEISRSVIISIASSLTTFSSFAAFLVLYATAPASARSPADIFSSVALFNLLASAFIVLPLSLASVVDAMIGMKRVAQYLASDELAPEEIIDSDGKDVLDGELAVSIENGRFEWEIFELDSDDEDEETKKKKKEAKKAEKKKKNKSNGSAPVTEDPEKRQLKQSFKLIDVNLEVQKGEFLAITGQIGSGKTSLLHAIDGVMKKLSGVVKKNGKIIMCGVPWIQNATFRDNITFGTPFDEGWYKEVIHACCLESDLEILPAGDLTEIGERGITLSGGQKARVSLARAVYANPDIILLDDVLSAVDSKVGKHIMDHCIHGLLSKKTKILATHQLALISSNDKVLFLNGDGSVSQGVCEELQRDNVAFANLMEHSKKSKREEDEEETIFDENETALMQRELSRKTASNIGDEVQYNEKVLEDGTLVEDEFKSVNAISFSVYKKYIGTGAIGFVFGWIIPFTLSLTVLSVFFDLFTNTWLSFWVEYKFSGRNDHYYISIYAVLTVLAIVTMILQFAGIVYIMNRSSRILNIQAAKSILYVPISYMDVTPMGRIINRFTKDTDVLDNEMGDKIAMIVFFAACVIGVLILCIIYLPWFAISVPFLVAIFIAVANFYQASGREIKRLEAVQRSKVYNNFNETLTGMETIKSYKKSDVFLNKNTTLIDRMNEAYYITTANQRWLDITLSILGTAFVMLVSFLCVFRVFDISPASVGLLLSYVLQISGTVSMLVVFYTQVEQDMNSAERVIEYVDDLPHEAPYIISETVPPPSWPEHGVIRFENVSLSYRPGLPLVLKDVNADIKGHEKIGICGRTGAGKSSIMVALYRIVELQSGKIEIDGLDILKLGLNNLRSKLSIIPQDPVLFKGTIRKNLDPFGEQSDEALWEVLWRAKIIAKAEIDSVKLQKDEADLHKFHLDQNVDTDGENFSLGEKQLIAFARALVRGSKVLILDEATSSVDYATDSKLQSAIIEEFANCTILCIAHRLKTILNYDRIIVMDKGSIVEFDTPRNLYNSPNSIFRLMCEKSGVQRDEIDGI